MEKNMQAIQPSNLTDEEILRQVYLIGPEGLPKEWVEELCARLAARIDEIAELDRESIYHEGFTDGFEQGVSHANDDFQ
jgi:flagellar biosynthesis/type III secretory pathway protein FliH